jgi:hypothetical protein
LTGPLGEFGGKLAGEFSQSTKQIHAVLSNFPEILSKATVGGLDEDAITKHFSAAIDSIAGPTSNEVKSQLTAAIGSFDPGEILKKAQFDPQGLVDEIQKKAFGHLDQIVPDAVKKLEDAFNSFGDQLTKYRAIVEKAGEAQDNLVGIQLEGLRSQRDIQNRRAGFVGRNALSVQEQNIPLNLRQQRLTGFGPVDAQNVGALGNELQAVVSQIQEQTQRRDSLLKQPGGFKEALKAGEDLDKLGKRSDDLQKALQNLTNHVERNAAAQERLAQINQEEQQRLSLAERFFTASPQERGQINRTAIVANRVATGQVNPNFLSTELRGAIVGLAHDLENIPTQIFGGLNGGEFLKNLFRGNPLTAGIAQLPVGREQERQGLENEILRKIAEAEAAQVTLMTFIQNQQGKFLSDLHASQSEFLTEFQRIFATAERDRVQSSQLGAQSRVTGLERQNEAVQTLRHLRVPDVNVARRIVASPDVEGLAGKVNLRRQLSVGFANTPKLVSQGVGLTEKDLARFSTVNDNQKFALVQKALDHLTTGLSNVDLPLTKEERGGIVDRTRQKIQATPFTDVGAGTINDVLIREIRLTLSDKLSKIGEDIDKSAIEIAPSFGKTADQLLYFIDRMDAINANLQKIDPSTNLGHLSKDLETARGQVLNFGNALKDAQGKISGLPKKQEENPVKAEPEARGGLIKAQPRKMGGVIFESKGTDTVPAMLSPKEFVVNADATRKNLPVLKAINSGKVVNASRGGLIKPIYLADGGPVRKKKNSTIEDIEGALHFPEGSPQSGDVLDAVTRAKGFAQNLDSSSHSIATLSNVDLSLNRMQQEVEGRDPTEKVAGNPADAFKKLRQADVNAPEPTQLAQVGNVANRIASSVLSPLSGILNSASRDNEQLFSPPNLPPLFPLNRIPTIPTDRDTTREQNRRRLLPDPKKQELNVAETFLPELRPHPTQRLEEAGARRSQENQAFRAQVQTDTASDILKSQQRTQESADFAASPEGQAQAQNKTDIEDFNKKRDTEISDKLQKYTAREKEFAITRAKASPLLFPKGPVIKENPQGVDLSTATNKNIPPGADLFKAVAQAAPAEVPIPPTAGEPIVPKGTPQEIIDRIKSNEAARLARNQKRKDEFPAFLEKFDADRKKRDRAQTGNLAPTSARSVFPVSPEHANAPELGTLAQNPNISPEIKQRIIDNERQKAQRSLDIRGEKPLEERKAEPVKLSRRMQHNIGHLDSILNAHKSVKPENIGPSDLSQAAEIQRFLAIEQKKNPSGPIASVLAEKKKQFDNSAFGNIYRNEQNLRYDKKVSQIQAPGTYRGQVFDPTSGEIFKTGPTRRGRAIANVAQNRFVAGNQAKILTKLTQKAREELPANAASPRGFGDEVTAQLKLKPQKRRGHVAQPQVAPIGNETSQFTPFKRRPIVIPISLSRAQKVPSHSRKKPLHLSEGGTVASVGTDSVPAMLSPKEFVVSAGAAQANLSLLDSINKGKPIYRQRGGPVGTSNNVQIAGNRAEGSWSLDQGSQESLNTFSQSAKNLIEPLQSFAQATQGLNAFAAAFRDLIAPLNVFSQNVQLLKNPFDSFNVAATNLSAGLALFNRSADAMASAMNNLSNLPKTITVQGSTQVNVVITGGEAFKAIQGQLTEDIKNAVITQLKPQLIADIKNGKMA